MSSARAATRSRPPPRRRGTRRRGAVAAALLAAAALVFPTRAAAADPDPDPWLGPDKALHFAASATIAAGGYALGAAVFDARGHALILGGGLAAAAGIGKEVLDAAGAGNPSWKDLAWDGLGVVTGLALAWLVDLAVRGTGDSHPLLTSPGAGAAPGRAASLHLTF